MVNKMNYKKYNQELFNFIEKTTSAFLGVETIKELLLKNDFIELSENESWNLNTNKKYFCTRNDSSILAFTLGTNKAFNISCTHIDTPSFLIKPKNVIYEKNYLKINVTPYGGLLNYAWLDEALSISGRVILKDKNSYFKKIIDFQKNLLCIPSVAIHQNENANDNLTLNSNIDMIPIISLNKEEDPLKKLINEYTSNDICDYDLFLYDTAKPIYFGLNEEFILSPRIDDLSCVYASLKGFIENKSEDNINIFCSFNSEEIGSLTKDGADSNFLYDTLKKIADYLKEDLAILINNSFILSADNTHATHPNHPGNSDVSNEALLNKGIVITKDTTTTTTSITSSIFKAICQNIKVPYQDYATKNDLSSGSTLSGISLRHVGADSIDIGLASLSMHGGKEVIGSMDSYYLYLAIKKFYETKIIKTKDKIDLIF